MTPQLARAQTFMQAFDDDQRRMFESAAEVLDLERNELLLRRGEPGGDLFYVRTGSLEAVDSRTTPEVILAVLPTGAVVGEMSFLDGSPRSVDVRASEPSQILRWAHGDLRALLRREPRFASTFYEQVALAASARMRRLTHNHMTGSLSTTPSIHSETGSGGVARAAAEGLALANEVKNALLERETRLRVDPHDKNTHEGLRSDLTRLQNRLAGLMTAWPDPESREAITLAISRELHPYLVRSTLADRCIRRPRGVVATAETLSHVLVGRPSGEGRFGETLDGWFLETPTLTALRKMTRLLPGEAATRLPTNRNRRVLLLNAGTGSVIAHLAQTLDYAPTTITVVDPSRTALAFLDTDVVPIDSNVDVVAVQENLAEFAVGRLRHSYTTYDLIILHGLLEYLPDRIAVSLLTTCASLLNRRGFVLSASLSESPDQHLLDRLLRWPTIRRSPEALGRLHQAARFRPTGVADTTAPAVLLTAQAPAAPVAPPGRKR